MAHSHAPVRAARLLCSPLVLTVALVAAVTVVRLAVIAGQPAPLSMDEAQYWIWSRDPVFGYFSKPPLLAWLIAAVTAVCGDGEACVRAASPVLHAATAVTVYGIGRRLYDVRVGAWSAATYVLLPGVSFSALIASTDVPLLLCWAVALYALIAALDEGRRRWWLLLGLAAGLGLLSKYAMLFFALGVAVLALWDGAARAALGTWRASLAALLALALFAPNLAWNAAHGFVSFRHTAANMNLGAALLHPTEALEFLGAQLGVFGPILFVVLVVAAWRAPAARAEKLLLAFSLPILAVITAQALLSRAHANWAATAYVAGTVLAAAWAVRAQRVVWLRASLALHLAAATVLYNYDALAQLFGVTLTRKTDPGLQARGWDAAGAWSSALQRQHPGVRFLFDERRTMTELIYYTRPHPLNAEMWNPAGKADNHFEMTSGLGRARGESFIFVTRRARPDDVLAAFAAATPLGRWRISAYPGHEIALAAFVVHEFRGYSTASVPPHVQ